MLRHLAHQLTNLEIGAALWLLGMGHGPATHEALFVGAIVVLATLSVKLGRWRLWLCSIALISGGKLKIAGLLPLQPFFSLCLLHIQATSEA
jgi:hypothetical protein